jgi:ABC-type antimicrobial peptide transport system permease subunit
MVIREGMVLTLIGFAIGVAGVAGAGRSISAFLYGVGSWDPATVAAVLALLLVVASGACLAPGWRASREDPARALRAD